MSRSQESESSSTRTAILKQFQQENLTAQELKALRIAAMERTNEDMRLAAATIITARERDGVLKIVQDNCLPEETLKAVRLATMRQREDDLNLAPEQEK
mmetsp:Transcript_24465/g.29553  ORF Transcript_24465/g.29553 Transcript_24465/m.29553 type:complete len:99 (+) Transcript_24465:5-301(+)